MSIKFNKAKPFPKKLITIFLLALVAICAYYLCINKPVSWLSEKYELFGKFVYDNDKILIIVILGANLLELVDFFISSKRDEAINANYEYLMDHIGFLTFFKQYFSPLFAKGPYFFATEDRRVAVLRKFVNFLSGIIKFVYWLVIILLIIAMISKPELKEIILNGSRDYIFTIFVIFLCINCNIFVYVLYKISPLYSSTTYRVDTYYSDGKITSQTKSNSNLVAMLLLGALIYVYFSLFYFSAFSTKLKRMIETDRFLRFVDKCDSSISILSFYYEK